MFNDLTLDPAEPVGRDVSFTAVTDLIALIVNPHEAQARLKALQSALKQIAEAQAALDAERISIAAEIETSRSELAKEREAFSKRLATLVEREREAKAFDERARAFAQKIGFHERPSFIPVGPGGLCYAVFDDEAPEPDPHFQVGPGFVDLEPRWNGDTLRRSEQLSEPEKAPRRARI